MLLAVEQDETTKGWINYFGEASPSVGVGQLISNDDFELLKIDKVKTFLVTDFAKGYLTQAFSKSTEENIKKMMDSVDNLLDNKLAYFWQGKEGKKSFPQQDGYNLSSSKLFRSAFKESVPELSYYMTSKEVKIGLRSCMNTVRKNQLSRE